MPDIRIERMTYRLQGGCSTPELIRLTRKVTVIRALGDCSSRRREPSDLTQLISLAILAKLRQRLSDYRTAALPTEPCQRAKLSEAGYFIT